MPRKKYGDSDDHESDRDRSYLTLNMHHLYLRDTLRVPRDPLREPRDALREPRDPLREPRDALREPRDPLREPRDALREPRDPLRDPRDLRRAAPSNDGALLSVTAAFVNGDVSSSPPVAYGQVPQLPDFPILTDPLLTAFDHASLPTNVDTFSCPWLQFPITRIPPRLPESSYPVTVIFARCLPLMQ